LNRAIGMKHFIFLTNEGFAESPNGLDIENSQVLGYSKGGTLNEVFDNFIKECSYLQEFGFNNIFAMELKNEEMIFLSLE